MKSLQDSYAINCFQNVTEVLLYLQERKELEQRVEEEIQKQESIMSAAGVESRTKRRCVIMREQMSKKKEWWEEEGLGSESEEDNERDLGTWHAFYYLIVNFNFNSVTISYLESSGALASG